MLASPPTFRWQAGAEGAPRTVHVWLSSGRIVAASWEMARLDVGAGEWELPADLWELVPTGATVHWNVRRVPDRSRGEGPFDQPGSRTGWFVRAP
jgi:hypothetical protein